MWSGPAIPVRIPRSQNVRFLYTPRSYHFRLKVCSFNRPLILPCLNSKGNFFEHHAAVVRTSSLRSNRSWSKGVNGWRAWDGREVSIRSFSCLQTAAIPFSLISARDSLPCTTRSRRPAVARRHSSPTFSPTFVILYSVSSPVLTATSFRA